MYCSFFGHLKNKKANFAPNKSYARVPFPEFYRELLRSQRRMTVITKYNKAKNFLKPHQTAPTLKVFFLILSVSKILSNFEFRPIRKQYFLILIDADMMNKHTFKLDSSLTILRWPKPLDPRIRIEFIQTFLISPLLTTFRLEKLTITKESHTYFILVYSTYFSSEFCQISRSMVYTTWWRDNSSYTIYAILIPSSINSR